MNWDEAMRTARDRLRRYGGTYRVFGERWSDGSWRYFVAETNKRGWTSLAQ